MLWTIVLTTTIETPCLSASAEDETTLPTKGSHDTKAVGLWSHDLAAGGVGDTAGW